MEAMGACMWHFPTFLAKRGEVVPPRARTGSTCRKARFRAPSPKGAPPQGVTQDVDWGVGPGQKSKRAQGRTPGIPEIGASSQKRPNFTTVKSGT